MNIAHVVPHLDEEAAGPAQSVVRLCESLALEEGMQVSLHTTAAGRSPAGVSLTTYPEWAFPNRFGFSIELVRELANLGRRVDVVHNHSLWSFPNMAAGLTTRSGGALLLTSPRGTLAAEARARSAFKKWLFKPLQWPVIDRAACLHATSRMEYQDIREVKLHQPVAIIPNGIDVPPIAEQENRATDNRCLRLLFLGRLHPIKGVEMLLEAWRELQAIHPRWEVIVAGKGEPAYVRQLMKKSDELGLERIHFPGAIYGADKRKLFSTSDLFVLPTKTENFGMAIAEALAQALPVITTRGAPWQGLTENRCGWWVERSQRNMVEAMNEAMELDPVELNVMGLRGREWMVAKFEWQAIARQMKSVYLWLHRGGTPPSCVILE